MRVLLAGPDFEENLSLRYLSSSLLSAGHETILAVFNSAADIEAVAEQAAHVDMVGLSMCFQSRAREFLQLAQLIKAHDPRRWVVAGGHYASCAAEVLLAHHPELDVIVIHEGERTLLEVAAAATELAGFAEIPGIAYRAGQQVRLTPQRRTLDDLDSLPCPDRRGPIHFIAGVPTSYMMGSRGCYGSCAYCCITTLHHMAPGKRFRQRNVERIADEMAALYQERGTRQFVFHDDNFLVPSEALNHARLSAFERALQHRGIENIALVIKCRPADAKKSVLRRLKDLGLVRVFLGVESATEQGLSALERRQTVDDSVRALETCGELGISAQFTLMTFNPDSTLQTLRSDVAFMRRFCGNPLNFCRAEIYAGTPLEQRMIRLGRARGNYLAREYDLLDAVAARTCHLSLDLFNARCWSNGSLMQNAIGLDHIAAVAKRFYNGSKEAEVCRQVASWLRATNLDTVDLLGEVLSLSVAHARLDDAGLQRALHDLRERETVTRQNLTAEATHLRAELDAFHLARKQSQPVPTSRFRFARRAAVAVLALGLPASAWQAGVSEMAPPPLKDGQGPPPEPGATQEKGSITGTVTDPSGAVLQRAKITVTNLDTKQAKHLTTDESGRFTAKDLPAGVPDAIPTPQGKGSLVGDVTDPQGAVVPNALVTITNTDTGTTRTATTDNLGHYIAGGLIFGHYTVKAEARGFKAVEKIGIVLEPGSNGRIDVALEIRADFKLDVVANTYDYGCCEYAATPLKVEQEDWATKKKPFTYYVGEGKDHGTLKGIAELVYSDPNMWVQIFEANRDVISKPGTVPAGTTITIPPRKRAVPNLIAKVLPPYPPEAKQQHVWGDVVMDVTLKEDGTVDQASVIDGPALLVETTSDAVKQWR